MVKRGTMGVNSLPKPVTRQRRDCDLNPGPSAPESSTLTTRLPSHPNVPRQKAKYQLVVFRVWDVASNRNSCTCVDTRAPSQHSVTQAEAHPLCREQAGTVPTSVRWWWRTDRHHAVVTNVRKVATPLRKLTCHMRSHSVTCHPGEVTFPPLTQPKLVLD